MKKEITINGWTIGCYINDVLNWFVDRWELFKIKVFGY